MKGSNERGHMARRSGRSFTSIWTRRRCGGVSLATRAGDQTPCGGSSSYLVLIIDDGLFRSGHGCDGRSAELI